MDLGLDGKVALVAGGSSGLGLAVAMELASEGAHVAIGARGRDRLAAAERAIGEVVSEREVQGHRVLATRVDITNGTAVRSWVDDVVAEFAPGATRTPMVFLASQRASFITGVVHLIDGGGSVAGGDAPHYTGAGRDTYT